MEGGSLHNLIHATQARLPHTTVLQFAAQVFLFPLPPHSTPFLPLLGIQGRREGEGRERKIEREEGREGGREGERERERVNSYRLDKAHWLSLQYRNIQT